MTAPRVVIADHHGLMREGMGLILRELYGTGTPIALAGSFAELRAWLSGGAADMILVDPDLPDGGGTKLLPEIRRLAPAAFMVVVSSNLDASSIRAAIEAGACGYIPKGCSISILRAALDLVMAGGIYVPAAVLNTPERHPAPQPWSPTPILSTRQRQVLTLVRLGLPNKEIAARLGTSEGTVKNHIKALMKKLRVRNRTQAALFGDDGQPLDAAAD